MPPERTIRKNRIACPHENQENRAVVIPGRTGGHVLPDLTYEVLGHEVPGPQEGIKNDLGIIVIDEVKSHRRHVSQRRDEQDHPYKILLVQRRKRRILRGYFGFYVHNEDLSSIQSLASRNGRQGFLLVGKHQTVSTCFAQQGSITSGLR